MVRQHQSLTAVKTLHSPPQSLLGKRKRINPSPERQEDNTRSQTPSLQLTRPNLLALSAQTQQGSVRSTQTYPHPFEDMVYPTPSVEKASSTSKSKEPKPKSATSGLAAEAILDLYNIHLGRNLPMPEEIGNLVRDLKVPRGGATTPNSKWVQAFKARPHKLLESTEIYALVKHLIYDPQWFPGDTEGEAMVAMELDQQWTAEVPKPPGYTDDTDLQNAMAKYGLPPKAKPDVSQGYDGTAFPGPLLTRVRALPQELLVCSDEPWLPWQTTQWKTAKGSQAKGEQQTRRDTSTSTQCMYRFFKHKCSAGDPEPSPAQTCVFSLQVYDEYCRYRVHWRRVDEETGLVSYEGDVIATALFDDERSIFDTRSVILNVLNWARTTRLHAIQQKLHILGSTPSVPAPLSTPQQHAGPSPHWQQGQSSQALLHPPPTPSTHQSKRARLSDRDQDAKYEDDLA
ncbi:MAG: hypothetical protein Q9218_006555 [Villophora microphyllina]